MAITIAKNALVTADDARIGNVLNQLSVSGERPHQRVTSWEDLAERQIKGIFDGNFELTTYADVTHEYSVTANLVGTTDMRFAVLPAGGATGSQALLFSGVLTGMPREAAVGQVQSLSIPGHMNTLFATGRVFYSTGLSDSDGPITVTGNSATVALGALGAGEEFIALQVVMNDPAVAGTSPTLAGKMVSAVTDFVTTTDQVTFSTATDTANLVQWATIDGDTNPITDTFWRWEATVGGTGSPSFSAVVVAAIRTKPA